MRLVSLSMGRTCVCALTGGSAHLKQSHIVCCHPSLVFSLGCNFGVVSSLCLFCFIREDKCELSSNVVCVIWSKIACKGLLGKTNCLGQQKQMCVKTITWSQKNEATTALQKTRHQRPASKKRQTRHELPEMLHLQTLKHCLTTGQVAKGNTMHITTKQQVKNSKP